MDLYTAGLVVLVGSGAVAVYTLAGYPAVLGLLRLGRRPRHLPRPSDVDAWPTVTISLPVYNEAHQIRDTLEHLVSLDYPRDRLQILVISDCSSDGTDEIVETFQGKGVELVRLPERSGKTAAENAATPHIRGNVVVNTDASIRIPADSLKPLLAPFVDPTIGVASGRDISVSRTEEDVNPGESGYVGYEMWVRELETATFGIVGASGCFYAIRAGLHADPVPPSLSRDFTAALRAREHGYRAVSVPRAVCFVPRTGSLGREYRRKVRTMTRGMQTLLSKRFLLNPLRHPAFAWMLFSHKVARWLLPWFEAAALAALAVLSFTTTWAPWLLAPSAVLLGLGLAGWWLADRLELPRPLELPAYLLASNVAAMHALIRVLAGEGDPIWEPTRRESRSESVPSAAE